MLIKFGDLVSASLYASRKNDEGYFAEIIHLHAGHMYGPLPTMGFAVLVSEYAAGDEDEVPEKDISIPWVFHIIGLILCIFSVITLSLALAYLAWIILLTLFAQPLVSILVIVVIGLCIFTSIALLSIYVMGLMKMITVIREGTQIQHRMFRFIIFSIVITFALLLFL